MTRILTIIALLFAAPAAAQAQIIDTGNLSGALGKGDMVLDRFGNPAVGLRAQREPELRRLRASQGRAILEGRIQVYDLTAEETEALLNAQDGAQARSPVSPQNKVTAGGEAKPVRPPITCKKINEGELVCKAEQ